MKVNVVGILIGVAIAIFIAFLIIPFFLGFSFSSAPSVGTASASIGIFKSKDGGLSWELASRSSDPALGLPVSALAFVFHPADSETIFLGTKGGGLWITKNGGTSWARVIDARGALKPNAEVYDVSIGRDNPKVIYLAAYQNERGQVLRSVDGGVTFEKVYEVPIARYGVFGVSVHPANPNQVAVATGQGGFLESKDGGVTWKVQRWFNDGLVRLEEDPAESGRLYAMTRGGGLFRTDNRGQTWTDLTGGYGGFSGALKISDFAVDHANPATLYTASRYGLLRSLDRGAVWSPVALIIPPAALPVRAVAADPANSNRIFAGIGGDLYRSDDFGERWQVLPPPGRGLITLARVSPKDSNVIYAVVGK